uniref:HTH CENPB-type domain-containing protein n=1 Tax=Ditylenchus dipsaci TaxID=166011 RepID=A0A915ES24_9BILA
MSDEELQLREEEGTPVTRKHRRNYSAEYKLEAIDWAHKYSINSAAKKFTKEIRSRIQDWLKNEDEIRRQVSIFIYYNFNCKLLTLGTHLPLERKLERSLAEWIRESRENKLPMSRRIISLEATQLFEGTGLKISNGWLNKFLKRHNFVLRCRTTTCQKPPADYIQAIAKFIIYVEQRRKAAKFSEIFAFNETSMEYDCTSNRVVDTRGAKDEDGPIGTLGLGHLREFRSQAMAADGHNDYEGSGISDDEAEVDLGDVDSDDELILDQNEDEVGYDFDWLL